MSDSCRCRCHRPPGSAGRVSTCLATGLLAVALGPGLLYPTTVAAGDAMASLAVDEQQAGLTAGALLVARRDLPDPNFFESVVLLLAYSPEAGAAGVVVNRRSDISVAEAVEGSGPLAGRDDSLYLGGPVGLETMVVLTRGERPDASSTAISEDIFLIDLAEGLEPLMEEPPPRPSMRFYIGYAGWSPGQLEDEVSRGVWHVMSGDSRWVFSEAPDGAWEALIRIVFGPVA